MQTIAKIKRKKFDLKGACFNGPVKISPKIFYSLEDSIDKAEFVFKMQMIIKGIWDCGSALDFEVEATNKFKQEPSLEYLCSISETLFPALVRKFTGHENYKKANLNLPHISMTSANTQCVNSALIHYYAKKNQNERN